MLAVAGVLAAVWFFTANDGATTSGPPVAVPGAIFHGLVPHAADVRRGNVVIVVDDPGAQPAAQLLADEVAGPPSPALLAAGQAVQVDVADGGVANLVVCRDREGRKAQCPSLHAYGGDRVLATTSPDDPALRAFVEYWLGRAAG